MPDFSGAQGAALLNPSPYDPDQRDHRRGWLGHVSTGRIGSGSGTTPDVLAVHLANEAVLLGPGEAAWHRGSASRLVRGGGR
jgi:hypothetical protein